MIRPTEMGQPQEIFNVVVDIRFYGQVIVPCSTEERAEWVVQECYNKYSDVISATIERSWLDEWNDDVDYLH